jgi:hypothetical protein
MRMKMRMGMGRRSKGREEKRKERQGVVTRCRMRGIYNSSLERTSCEWGPCETSTAVDQRRA